MIPSIDEQQRHFQARARERSALAKLAQAKGHRHYAVPCLCHSQNCPDWHVAPLLDTHGVCLDLETAEFLAWALNGQAESPEKQSVHALTSEEESAVLRSALQGLLTAVLTYEGLSVGGHLHFDLPREKAERALEETAR